MRANFGVMTQHRFARDRDGRTLLRLVGLWTLIGCFVRLTRHSEKGPILALRAGSLVGGSFKIA
jgi:hypothetical protein